MTVAVHIYPRLERQLATLEQQVNAPAIAAGRARAIIKALIQGSSPASAGLLRPKPDRRLKNSLKFNLGSGFRLICIREKSQIFIMFAGDHDSCDVWLTANSKGKPHRNGLQMDVYAPKAPKDRACPPHADARYLTPGPDLADPCLNEISQADLRRVFRGLVQQAH